MNKKTLFLILLIAVVVLPTIVSGQGTGSKIGKALQTAAVGVGFPLIIVGWIVAGILYLTSAGGSQMQVAKTALIACVIGTLLVVVAANACNLVNGLFGGIGSGC